MSPTRKRGWGRCCSWASQTDDDPIILAKFTKCQRQAELGGARNAAEKSASAALASSLDVSVVTVTVFLPPRFHQRLGNSRLSTTMHAVLSELGDIPFCAPFFCRLRPHLLGLPSGQRGVQGRARRPTPPTGRSSPHPGTPAPHRAGFSAPTCFELGPRARASVGPVAAAWGADRGWLPAPCAGSRRTEGGHTSSEISGSGRIQPEGSGGRNEH